MKIKKKYRFIDIKIKDLWEYTDVALLVDKKSFLEVVEALRNKYKLNYDYPLTDTDKIYFDFEYKFFNDEKLKAEFYSDVEKLRKKYKLPPHFSMVIKSAIIYGVVKESDYKKAYLEEQVITPLREEYEIPDIKYCIVIHPGTRKQDVEKVFDEFKEKVRINYKGSQKEKDNYKFGYGIDLSLAKMKPNQPSTETVRKWYIRVENGEGPLRIALDIKNYTYKQYKDLVEKFKHPTRQKQYEDNSKIDKELQYIYSRRNTVKSQVNRYGKLVQASFL